MIVPKIKANYCIIGLLIAVLLGYAVASCQGRRTVQYYRERTDQINRDFDAIRNAEREAAERADRIQKELESANERIRQLQSRIDGLRKTTTDITSRIGNAQDAAAECGNLIGENQAILRRIQDRGRTQN